MHFPERTYRLTVPGRQALQAEKSVPIWYRTILALVERGAATSEAIGAAMAQHSRREVTVWLGQLETLELIELVPGAEEPPAESISDFAFDVVLGQRSALAARVAVVSPPRPGER